MLTFFTLTTRYVQNVNDFAMAAVIIGKKFQLLFFFSSRHMFVM